MVEAGIVDPAKVTRSAVENAASIAAMVLTTEAMITDKPEPEAAPAMPPGGMGGMDFDDTEPRLRPLHREARPATAGSHRVVGSTWPFVIPGGLGQSGIGSAPPPPSLERTLHSQGVSGIAVPGLHSGRSVRTCLAPPAGTDGQMRCRERQPHRIRATQEPGLQRPSFSRSAAVNAIGRRAYSQVTGVSS